MGGPAAVLQKAQQYYDKGEYRWTAEANVFFYFITMGLAIK
jgi:alkyl sulfatase BDS1-like metallo-beta-lactamase superfamily hydrolase